MRGFWRVGFLAAAAVVAAILSSGCANSLVSGGTVPMTRGRPVYETFLAAQQGAGIIWDDTAHQTYSDTVNTNGGRWPTVEA